MCYWPCLVISTVGGSSNHFLVSYSSGCMYVYNHKLSCAPTAHAPAYQVYLLLTHLSELLESIRTARQIHDFIQNCKKWLGLFRCKHTIFCFSSCSSRARDTPFSRARRKRRGTPCTSGLLGSRCRPQTRPPPPQSTNSPSRPADITWPFRRRTVICECSTTTPWSLLAVPGPTSVDCYASAGRRTVNTWPWGAKTIWSPSTPWQRKELLSEDRAISRGCLLLLLTSKFHQGSGIGAYCKNVPMWYTRRGLRPWSLPPGKSFIFIAYPTTT